MTAVAVVFTVAVPRVVVAWTLATAIERLDSQDRLLRDTSETRLRTLDDPGPVVRALSHERAEVRRRAVWILAPRGTAVAAPVAECLGDADAGVRRAACEVLASMEGPDVAAALGRAATDSDAGVRRAAVEALSSREDAPADGDAAWRVAVARGARWLVSKQGADGGWHGAAYGVFEDGRSVTPFVLLTLLDTPEELRPPVGDAVRRAFEFMARERPEDAPFATYATALALQCVVRARPPGWERRAAAHVEWIRRAQFSEGVGCEATDPAHGAWGLEAARRGDFARADLSATCFVLRALREAGVPSDDAMLRRAAVFVGRCQNAAGDGGFFLSTNSPAANKAGGCGEYVFQSYGSATADGALARAALVGEPDPAALRWLAANPEATRTPGFREGAVGGWDLGVMFYYCSERSLLRDALRRADDTAARAWEDGVRATILGRRRADGSWANEISLMREDEPLVATSFAVQTLVRLGRP